METVVCDLCGASDEALLYRWDQWEQGLPAGMATVRCRQCGLMYVNPRPDRSEIGAYYGHDYAPYRGAIEDERLALMRWMRRRKLVAYRRRIIRHGGLATGRILDVGCATGLFLHEMSLGGWQTAGVELSPAAAEYARRRFGLDVHTGMLAEGTWQAGSFDVVTYWDVLEHTFGPRAELAQANRLLRPGGLIVVNIPNWHSPDRRLFGPYWIGYDPPRHLFVFTRATLTRLLTENGFHPAAWECVMPGYFSTLASIERWQQARHRHGGDLAYRILQVPGMRLATEPVFGVLRWLRMAGSIAVFARKMA